MLLEWRTHWFDAVGSPGIVVTSNTDFGALSRAQWYRERVVGRVGASVAARALPRIDVADPLVATLAAHAAP